MSITLPTGYAGPITDPNQITNHGDEVGWLYNNLLDRGAKSDAGPDPAKGYDYWLDRLDGANTYGDNPTPTPITESFQEEVHNFVRSDEFQANLAAGGPGSYYEANHKMVDGVQGLYTAITGKTNAVDYPTIEKWRQELLHGDAGYDNVVYEMNHYVSPSTTSINPPVVVVPATVASTGSSSTGSSTAQTASTASSSTASTTNNTALLLTSFNLSNLLNQTLFAPEVKGR